MKRLLSVLLAIVVGLVVGELAAAMRDHWGFPHYNGYVADPVLGVRLQPDFDTVLAFKDNPPGAIHVNHQGYRGADWPEGRTGEIAVIGDSQVFGLGVGNDETTPARLERALVKPVLNLGVPTYGPDEYLALIDEIAPRKPALIVLAINFANDLFELGAPNRGRHVVLDGWAVRGDTAPTTLPFPGRSWLFQRSHLVFAARELLHRPTQVEGAIDTPSTDLPTPAPAPVAVSLETVNAEVQAAVRALGSAEEEVIQTWLQVSGGEDPYLWTDALRAMRGGARVGDIVEQNFAEAAFRFELTAGWLSAARRLRQEAPERLAAWVLANPRAPERKGAEKALRALSQARDDLSALDGRAPVEGGRPSAFRRFLADASGRARRAGAELVVLALPLDVQVDSRQFAKYGLEPRDMGDSLGLLTDLCDDAAHLGLRCADPTAALRERAPEMFLDGDIHLTAAGQEVVAGVLVQTLDEPAPAPRPFLGIPEGRSRFPDPLEWETVSEIQVTGSSKNNCATQRLREYLRVDCRRAVLGYYTPDGEPWKPSRGGPLGVLAPEARGEVLLAELPWNVEPRYGPRPMGVGLREGPLDRVVWSGDDEVGLIVPLLPDRAIVADFTWADHAERLTVPPGPVPADLPLGAFAPLPQEQAAKAESLVETCAGGQLRGGALGVCLDPCAADGTCSAGRCTDWAGLKLCI